VTVEVNSIPEPTHRSTIDRINILPAAAEKITYRYCDDQWAVSGGEGMAGCGMVVVRNQRGGVMASLTVS
jgi:hypothetical protein